MNNKPTVSNRSQLAALYCVTLKVFNNWIDANKELKKIFEPFTTTGRRTLPPVIVNKVFEVLGEP